MVRHRDARRSGAWSKAGGSAGEKRTLPPARGRKAGAGRWRSRPGERAVSSRSRPCWSARSGEREARHWRGESVDESDVARSDWSTCRDLIGPRVVAVFDRLELKKFEKNAKKHKFHPQSLYIYPYPGGAHSTHHSILFFSSKLPFLHTMSGWSPDLNTFTDRAKAAARKTKTKGKGKGKEATSSESTSEAFKMKNLWGGLVKAKLLKQWNILNEELVTYPWQGRKDGRKRTWSAR